MRAYLDTLSGENKALAASVADLEARLSQAQTASQAIQHNRALLEEALHRAKEKVPTPNDYNSY